MTFDEIREMVNATITENGQRQITGKALNLALLEIITAMEENKPEGDGGVVGTEVVYLVDNVETGELTSEHQASNAAVYARIMSAIAEGRPIPCLVVDTTPIDRADAESNGGNPESIWRTTSVVPNIYITDPQNPPFEGEEVTGVFMYDFCCGSAVLNEDGSVIPLT